MSPAGAEAWERYFQDYGKAIGAGSDFAELTTVKVAVDDASATPGAYLFALDGR